MAAVSLICSPLLLLAWEKMTEPWQSKGGYERAVSKGGYERAVSKGEYDRAMAE